ncbi:MAG: hypothetical protein R8M45_06405 [Ghiorsea sp.]
MLFRLLFGVSLLVWAMLAAELWLMLCLTLLSVLILLLRGAKALLFWRSFSLLLWLFLPIIIFQSLFSTGTYIQKPIPLPLTIEGLNRALFLCLHMLLIFFSALTCFRLLAYKEWLRCLYAVPSLGTRIEPYLLLLDPLQTKSLNILHKQRDEWQQTKRKWLYFPQACVQMIEKMLTSGQQEAQMLWEDWEIRSAKARSVYQQPLPPSLLDVLYATIMLLGWFFWSLYWMH